MRRLSLTLLVLSLVFCLTGCGEKQTAAEAGLTISKDGRITSVLVNSFEKEYYDIEELQEMIQLEIAAYNQDTGREGIRLESLEIQEGNCVAVLTYQGAEDYAAYNEIPFFAGTVQAAMDAGVDLSVTLTAAGKENTIGRAELSAMQDSRLLVWYGEMPVTTPGKILYYGGNLQILGSKKIVAEDGASVNNDNSMKETEEPAGPFYLIYK